MNKEINLNDVIEFIKKYGHKYNYQIQRELDKTRKFTNEDINEEIKENYDLYKRMSNKSCLIKLENILKDYFKKNTHICIYANSIYIFENKTNSEKCIDFRDNFNISTIIIDILNNDNKGDSFEKFNNYLKYGVKEYWVISTQWQMFQVHTYDIINKSYVSFLQEPYKKLRSRLFPDLVINMEDIFEKIK